MTPLHDGFPIQPDPALVAVPVGRTRCAAAQAPAVWQHCLALVWAFLTGITLAGAAMAQTTTSLPASTVADAGQRFASVLRLRGEVSATSTDGTQVRVLRPGDRVYVGERVHAGGSSEAVLRTEDAGLLAVRPGGVFLAERYAAEGKPTDNLSLRILTGSVRMITGWIGHSNRAGYRVQTPSATIGIRGTDHEPFVITPELASNLSQAEGTYDKVNRGGTTLDANGNRLDIAPGRVGFVRASRPATTRSLLTVLLPVLLDRVPGFFVPGEFDAELDQLSQRQDEESLRLLDEFRRTGAPGTGSSSGSSPAVAGIPPPAAAVSAPAASASPAAEPVRRGTNSCGANAVARTWLAQFDRAILRRNAAGVLQLFAEDAQLQATVRLQDGSTSTIDIGREAFVQSTLSAIAGLTDYRQRRVSTEGWPRDAGDCSRIGVRSVVIEQGRQAGSPYRFEATEDYLLERRAGKWLAVRAATTQR